jgi:3-oxoacyl-[acyl-carrier-protein] synthase-3
MSQADAQSSRDGGIKRVGVVGTGSYLPDRILTNADLEKMVDTSDEWIRTRTGIRTRHMARDDEAASDMAAVASRRALESAGITPDEIDLIIVATITPDMPFPNTACFVQQIIGARNAFCFDVEAACSGFLYGMEIARQFIEGGLVSTALVIGSEKLSCITDWNDRATCVLFGDGAGAVVLRGIENGRGIMSTVMGSDGGLTDLLNLPGGGSRNPATKQTVEAGLHCMKMTGNEVFKHAVRCMCDASQQALERSGLTIEDVNHVIPHQANMRIIKAIANRLGGCMDKFRVNLDRVGNMSGASVPVALDETLRNGLIKKGDVLLFVVFGGGFTWGASVMEW